MQDKLRNCIPWKSCGVFCLGNLSFHVDGLTEDCNISITKVNYSISQEICTRFLLCCALLWLYIDGFSHIHQAYFTGTVAGNLTIAPVPAKQPWWIWINTSFEFIMNDCITTTKQSATKPCAYFLGYTVHPTDTVGCNHVSMSLIPDCGTILLIWYSISQEICTRFCCALLCCGYAIVHNEFTWSIYPYSSGLLCWHWGNR